MICIISFLMMQNQLIAGLVRLLQNYCRIGETIARLLQDWWDYCKTIAGLVRLLQDYCKIAEFIAEGGRKAWWGHWVRGSPAGTGRRPWGSPAHPGGFQSPHSGLLQHPEQKWAQPLLLAKIKNNISYKIENKNYKKNLQNWKQKL